MSFAPSSLCLFRIGEDEYVHQNRRKNQGDCEMAISEGLSLDVRITIIIIIIITWAGSIQSHQVKHLHVFLGSICKNVYKFTDEELQQPGEDEADYWW